MAGSDHPVDVDLRAGDTLLLYTDGLVEAQRDIIQGLRSLAETAAEARDLAAPQLARALVERSLEGAARRDDSLALVVRRTEPEVVDARGDGAGPFRHRGSPHSSQVAVARHHFIAWLAAHGATSGTDRQSLVEDLEIAVSELVANAARAASTYFEVSAVRTSSGYDVTVEDDGPGFGGRPVAGMVAEPDAERESGRGLFIVNALVDELDITERGGGTAVRFRKDWPDVDRSCIDARVERLDWAVGASEHGPVPGDA